MNLRINVFLNGVRAFRHPKYCINWNSIEKYSSVSIRQLSQKGVSSLTEQWLVAHCGGLGALVGAGGSHWLRLGFCPWTPWLVSEGLHC